MEAKSGKKGKGREVNTREESWDGYWGLVEAGRLLEPIAAKHGGVPLLNQFACMSLRFDLAMAREQFIKLDDGIHYCRVPERADKISGAVDARIRVLFAFRSDQFAQAMERVDEDIRREYFPREVPEANGTEPPDLGRASLFVRQLSALHDTRECNDLTPGLSAELDASIQLLEEHADGKPWVSATLEVARSLREHMASIIVTERCHARWLCG